MSEQYMSAQKQGSSDRPNEPALRPRIGVLGCGRMGGAAALNLAERGYTVAVHDVDSGKRSGLEEGGCTWAVSIADLAKDADVVLVSLPGPDEVRHAVSGKDGLLSAWVDTDTITHTVVDLSTVGPAAARDVATLCRAIGVGYVDAPIAGNPDQTRDGSMRLLVGGDDADVQGVEWLLSDLSSGYQHFGGPGAGQAAKLALNAIQGAFLAGLSEGLAHLMRLDIEIDKFVDIAAGMDYQGWVKRTLNALVNDTYDFGFTIDLLIKDLRLATESRATVGAPWAMSAAAHDTFALGQEAGVGGLNLAALTRVLAEQEADR